MGLLDFLFGHDLTRTWVREPERTIEFDFTERSLAGTRLGDRIEELSFLGPAEEPRSARRGLLSYFSLGLEIDIEDELLKTFRLIWEDPADQRFSSFTGVCRLRGKVVPLHRESTFVDVVRHLGQPDEQEEDSFGKVFCYTRAGFDVEVVFDELDLLLSVSVLPVDNMDEP